MSLLDSNCFDENRSLSTSDKRLKKTSNIHILFILGMIDSRNRIDILSLLRVRSTR